MKQPDFKKLFQDLAGGRPQKINYKIRTDSNLFHDMIFLDSLIHDSRFKIGQIRHVGKKITIPIERDCWELSPEEHGNSLELYITNSSLVISPVYDVTWSIKETKTVVDNEILWISSIWLSKKISKNDEDYRELEISGHNWSLTMVIREEFSIYLRDLQEPYLYSKNIIKNIHNF